MLRFSHLVRLLSVFSLVLILKKKELYVFNMFGKIIQRYLVDLKYKIFSTLISPRAFLSGRLFIFVYNMEYRNSRSE